MKIDIYKFRRDSAEYDLVIFGQKRTGNRSRPMTDL